MPRSQLLMFHLPLTCGNHHCPSERDEPLAESYWQSVISSSQQLCGPRSTDAKSMVQRRRWHAKKKVDASPTESETGSWSVEFFPSPIAAAGSSCAGLQREKKKFTLHNPDAPSWAAKTIGSHKKTIVDFFLSNQHPPSVYPTSIDSA